MISEPLEPYLAAIECELREGLSESEVLLPGLYAMLAYHFGWQDSNGQPTDAQAGKRLRPLLCLLTCEAAGGEWELALPAAGAVELVHNFSLIHDDIEDKSPLRRGRPTLWSVWGLGHGVNCGDMLLVLARHHLLRIADGGADQDTVLKAVAILDRALLRLCRGQYLDISGEGKLDATEQWYEQMIGGKTATLLAASAEIGALIARRPETLAAYRDYGWQLGLTFQMVDDLIGIWGDAATTGKSAATDIQTHKMTLPVIYAMRNGSEAARLSQLYAQSALNDQEVVEVVGILERSGARDYVQSAAHKHERLALAALDLAEAQGAAADHLRQLTTALTERVA